MALVTWLLRKHFPDWEDTPLGSLQLLVDLSALFYSCFLFLSWKRRTESYHRDEKLWEADGCSLLATERES